MLEVSHPWHPAPPQWHPWGERGEHTRRVCVAPMNPRGGVSPPTAVMLKIASLLSQFIVYLSSAHFSFILVSVNLVLFVPLFQQLFDLRFSTNRDYIYIYSLIIFFS